MPPDLRRRQVETHLPAAPLPPVNRYASIAEAMERAFVPGASVAVVSGGTIAWTAGYGVTAGGGEPVTPATIFQACSISKPVAALAALRLVADGLLNLDEDVNTRLTSWQVPANGDWQPRVTLRQLLGHSAALTYCWYPGYLRDAPTPTLAQTLAGERPANTPPIRVTGVPGLRFRYAGSHYSVLQQLMVDVTGCPFPDLMYELIFEPLGMRSSSYGQRFPDTYSGGVAHGHNEVGDPLQGGWRIIPEMAAAGLWTTPEDLARLALEIRHVHTGGPAGLLNRATTQEMLTPQHGDWGLGWQLATYTGRLHIQHSGDNIGYKCWLICDIDRGEGIVVMTNSDSGWRVAQDIMQAAADTYRWPLPSPYNLTLRRPADDRPVSQPDASTLPAYVGTYRISDGVQFAVTVGEQLTLHIPDQPELPLRSLDRLTYAADATNVLLSFTLSNAERATTCTLHIDGIDLTAQRIG